MSNAEPKTVRYLSKYASLKLVVRPMRSKEIDGQIITTEGESIRFVDAAYETNVPEEISYIEARPEFKSGIIYRVPDDVSDLVAHRIEREKDLEQREADLKAREDALAAKEQGIQGSEEGARVAPTGGDTEDDLKDLNRAGLVQIAEELELDPSTYKVGTKNDAIKDAIRAKRAALAAEEGGDTSGAPAY